VILQPIVEGHGEVHAVPTLLHRVCSALGAPAVVVKPPIRMHRSQLVIKNGLEGSIRMARLRRDLGGIVVILDADDDCPKEAAPRLSGWAKAAAAPIACEVVLANREFEAWFLGGLEGLRRARWIRPDAVLPADPESVRDAKGAFDGLLDLGRTYLPTVDQKRLAGLFDLERAADRCRSFRRLKSALRSILDRAA